MNPVASDGLRARPGRIWTVEKLTYLQNYASAFTTAMRGKWERLVYIDLLAGPGRDIDLERNKEFDGSPLIALHIRPAFDHCFFGDKDRRNVDILKKRIAASDAKRVSVEVGDCNVLIDKVVKQISQKTLGLAFVDLEGFEVDFRTLRILAKRRIDVLYWFPSGIAIRRNLKNFQTLTDSPMNIAAEAARDYIERAGRNERPWSAKIARLVDADLSLMGRRVIAQIQRLERAGEKDAAEAAFVKGMKEIGIAAAKEYLARSN